MTLEAIFALLWIGALIGSFANGHWLFFAGIALYSFVAVAGAFGEGDRPVIMALVAAWYIRFAVMVWQEWRKPPPEPGQT